MFYETDRVRYRKAPILEVICQLRFPTILSISSREPADFQEAIRGDYPIYKKVLEQPVPKVIGQPGNMRLEEQEKTVNYNFISQDGRWKVNLTNSFVSLATPAYTVWEDFAARLDKILAAFIPVYSPASFERIGLRFINVISRKALGIEDCRFRDLIQPCYLGLLGEEDVVETKTARAEQNVEMALPGGCNVKLHAGPGLTARGKEKDSEVKFILDQDVFMSGKIAAAQLAPALNIVHSHTDRIFRGAITRTLHDAMEPELL